MSNTSTVKAAADTATANHPVLEGMGNLIDDNGVGFRVWAPNADRVCITGQFTDWKEELPMTHEANGYWYGYAPGASLGQEYRFVIYNGEQRLERNDPYARQLTSSVGNSVITTRGFEWDNDEYRAPAWHEMVIYELHVGTFNRDRENKPGTFKTLIEKLPYLAELGVNTLQLLPVNEFPGDFSWGYNLSHIYAIEKAYGGVEGFKQLVKEAHKHGIAIIIDVVYNHLGPGDLDLWRFDGWYENDGGGIYFYNDERGETPWGPRPNFGRPEVCQYLIDNALMWLEEYHVDGLRIDSTLYMRRLDGTNPETHNQEGYDFLVNLNKIIIDRLPWKIIFAEDLQGDPMITQSIDQGGMGYCTQWDSRFVYPIRKNLIAMRDEERDMEEVAAAIMQVYNEDAFQRVIYTESHDDVANGKARMPQEISPEDTEHPLAKKRSVLGAGLVFTSPGIPLIFQGQEFFEDGWFDEHRQLDWAKADKFEGLLACYRELIRLRRNWYNNSAGLKGHFSEVLHLNAKDKIIAWHRWCEGGPGDSVVIIANLANQTQQGYAFPLPGEGLWHVRFNSDWQGYDEDFNNTTALAVDALAQPMDGHSMSGLIDLGPYSLVILSQDKGEANSNPPVPDGV